MKGKWKALGWKGVTMASLHQNDLILLLVGNLVSAPGHAWRMRFFPSSLDPSRKRNQALLARGGQPPPGDPVSQRPPSHSWRGGSPAGGSTAPLLVTSLPCLS